MSAGVVVIDSAAALVGVLPGERVRIGAGVWHRTDGREFEGVSGLVRGRTATAQYLAVVADAARPREVAGTLTARAVLRDDSWSLTVTETVGEVSRPLVAVAEPDLFIVVPEDPAVEFDFAAAEIGFARVTAWARDEDGRGYTATVTPLPAVVVPEWADSTRGLAPADITADGGVVFEFEATMGSLGEGLATTSVYVNQTAVVHGREATTGPARVAVYSEGPSLTVAEAQRVAGWLRRASGLVAKVNAASFKAVAL